MIGLCVIRKFISFQFLSFVKLKSDGFYVIIKLQGMLSNDSPISSSVFAVGLNDDNAQIICVLSSYRAYPLC